MKHVEPRTLKGFRDFLPKQVQKRQYIINTLKRVFASFGFEPLETPALEYEDILRGKYGEEGDKLMYRFEDNGGRRVALRYDQTVPLARVVSQYQNDLPLPFKRYQIQPVWRAENTQKGRFREFLQCDIDSVGIDSPLADAEVIAVAVKSLQTLGFKDFKVLVNDRENLRFQIGGIVLAQDKNIVAVRSIDKLKKIGREGVLQELQENNFSLAEAEGILETVETTKPTKRIQEVFTLLETLGIDATSYEFSPTLARGLDYYTGLILEAEIAEYNAGSVLGGGRYDKLIGMFAGKDIPAVGFAFGFDRLMEALEQCDLFPRNLLQTQVLVTIFSPELKDRSTTISSQLRAKGIATELYLDENAKMEKQLKYADQKQIPFVVILGPEEIANKTLTLKTMRNRQQQILSFEELLKQLI